MFDTTQVTPRDLIPITEVASILNCTRQTVWNYCKRGILPSYLTGEKFVYSREEVEELRAAIDRIAGTKLNRGER